MILILIFYLFSTFFLGWTIVKKWFGGLPTLLSIVGAFLLGTGIGVPITYFLAVLFSKTSAPILWGTITASAAAIVIRYQLSHPKADRPLDDVINKNNKISLSEIALIVFSMVFSTWLMTKTFHGNTAGELFVGSNNIFDFGFMVGLVRSISWGSNIPIQEPFFAGFPLFYHFFFAFWVALWEYFGVPIVWAMNIPSILSFTAMLVVIYYLPQIIAKQKPLVGWIAVLLTITNSSLTFWKIVGKQDIWHLSTYPFAGPFDGSTISIFVTLNSYVNQRHLAFAIAYTLFLFLVFIVWLQQKKISLSHSVKLGVLTGVLFLWNTVVFLLAVGIFGFVFVMQKRWKSVIVFGMTAATVAIIVLAPQATLLYKVLPFLGYLTESQRSLFIPTWNIAEYLWENLSILPVVAVLGYIALTKKTRQFLLPFIIFFVGACMLATVGKRGFDQKLLSFFIIGINVLAAVGLMWLWERRTVFFRACAIGLCVMLTVSGVIDLFPIKNEFAYPLIGKDSLPLISWIRTNTNKNSVFVSYEDMIDPVVLGGRTNYYGFFKNVGQYDRSADVRRIYAGDVSYAKTIGISYILVPKWQKNDFPYVADTENLRKRVGVAYEDSRFTVFAIE